MVDIEAFKYALSNFGKGVIFENFAHPFMSHVIGDEFIPVGGSRDRGIDGLKSIYSRGSSEKYIYQISTEIDVEGKVNNTVETLDKNGIEYSRLFYVTSRKVNSKDKIEDAFFDRYGKPLTINDVIWFSTNVQTDEILVKLYDTYIKSNIHEFNKPDKNYVVSDFITDPRLFIFLRQQIDDKGGFKELENTLADSLILYSLEGTSHDDREYLSAEQIMNKITTYIQFAPKSIEETIRKRLAVLSTKPRQVNHHNDIDKYCLPYLTRLKLTEKDIDDSRLYDAFREQTSSQLSNYLSEEGVRVRDVFKLVDECIHKIYHQQGIEFSTFILEGRSRDSLEIVLPELVNEIVDNSTVVMKNKQAIKRSLLMTIRNVAYNGTPEQNEYLRRLSQTYSMMFMLRWDPQLAASFQKLASQLKIYVGTSIIIPALSELFLEKKNRRYWNLLEGAHQSGVTLTINQTILDELIGHFKKIKYVYNTMYKANEDFYLENEMQTLYVDEIMIRAYFYSKRRGKVDSFKEFLEEYVNSRFSDLERDLKLFLEEEFKIEFEDTTPIEVNLDEDEVKLLTEELKSTKQNEDRARNDAKLILMVYKLRKVNEEFKGNNVFGYKTWWLSQDINTYKAVQKVFDEKYPVNCYMRTDFLYNYISLSPKRKEVDRMFKEVFPSLLGINLSYHLPKDVCVKVNETLNEHQDKSRSRVKRAIRQATEKLMTKGNMNEKKIASFYEEEIQKELVK